MLEKLDLERSNQEISSQNGTDDNDNNDMDIRVEAIRRRLISVPRTCNSEDGPQAIEQGICSKNANDYSEVRVWSQNWESAIIASWMMQIIYSELVGVPSTIETGVVEKNANFYDVTNRMDYGKANEYKMFEYAHSAPGGDCSIYRDRNEKVKVDVNADDYIPCAHAVMEIWSSNGELKTALKEEVAEQTEQLGVIGNQGWHVTRSSIQRDPSLAHYFGLQGDSNRQKLADTFKRPTTWKHYCTYISQNNCTTPDDVATQPPAAAEEGKYFVEGPYTGFFRKTEKNDCNKTENCTGHIMDYPCGWSSFIRQQTKHLKIALESGGSDGGSGGYTYSEMVQIWSAANATKSDVIGLWWTPDATANLFKGSGSDLMPVLLPPPTQECLDNRIDILKRCDDSATEFDIYGDEKGACGRPSIFTMKAAVGNMQLNIQENKNPKSRMSPAYEVYDDFYITDLQVDEILTEWVDRGVDKYNFDLRFATCKWMADNLEYIVETVIPPDHPRIFVEPSNTSPLTIVTLVLSAIAIILTIFTAFGMCIKWRQGTLGRGVQIEFLALLLAGLLLVSIGSLLMALEPTKETCVGSIWMVIVGYTLQLVPTLIRVSAIIKIIRASRKFRIVKVNIKILFTRSIGISTIAALYCMLWTITETPGTQKIVHVSEDKNVFGETIVSESNACDSTSSVWFNVSFGCQAILLIGGSFLAWQMRTVPDVVNDSRELALMIYASFIFLLLRFMIYIFSGSLSAGKDSLQKMRSICCSIDTMATIVIFFSRFFREKKKRPSVSIRGGNFVERAPRRTCVQTSGKNSGEPRSSNAGGVSSTLSRVPVNSSEIYAAEEKEEEDATIRISTGRQTFSVPKWVLEEFGEVEDRELEQIIEQPTASSAI